MGIYDRDYERYDYEGAPGVHLGGPKSMVVKIVIVTAIVYVLQLVTRQPGDAGAFTDLLSLEETWYRQPWKFFQLLTYGFLHSPQDMWHILMNMFVLWMFGTRVEERYGSKEFLAFYLVSIVFAAVCWNLTELMSPGTPSMLGASGGVSAVLLLFIFNYPRVTVLLMFVIPVPAWVLGILIVGGDAIGAMGRYGNTAFTAHLGGFLFALLYFKLGWRITNWLPRDFSMPSFKRKPPLRVHRPSDYDEEDPSEKRLNELLAKIHAQGQDSLTGRERRELEKLSRHYRNKRN